MGRNLRKLLLGFAFSPPSTPSALNAARPLTLTVVKIRNKKKTFSSTDNYFKPSREALSKSCKIIFHHATRGETDDGNEKLDRSVGDGKSHKVFTPSTKWQLRLSHQKEKQRKNFDVEMEGKISFLLCVEIYFSLYFLSLTWGGNFTHPSTTNTALSTSLSAYHPKRPLRKPVKGKQIEKRDCFEIHRASQVPTVPFGFPFIPNPPLSPPPPSVRRPGFSFTPPSGAPLLFVKEITFFFFSATPSRIRKHSWLWSFSLSIRFLWAFLRGWSGTNKFHFAEWATFRSISRA